MPKIDINQVPVKTGSAYPAPYAAEMAGRSSQRLSDAGRLTQFDANIVRLAPGAKSSLRHWHENQDEFVMVTEGALTLVDDHGQTPLAPGDCAAFPAGDRNGHHIVNLSDKDGAFLVVGTRTETEVAWYSDADLKATVDARGMTFTKADGTPFDT